MVFKILQYSEMECNCVKKFTEGLFREYKYEWQHKYESTINKNRAKNNIHLGWSPLYFEVLSFSLSSL
jgi:hypothetical protein